MRRGSWDDAVALVEDGSSVAFSGAVLRGKPVAAARALARAGRRDLELITFTGSLEVELLLAAGALGTIVSSYVGLGPHGLARGFSAAVAEGRIEDRELSEWMLVGGLRAAVMGLPFLPTRAALGSQLAEERGFRTILDPYTGDELLAVPAIRPDVAFVHAWRADEDGNVQFPWPPDHLADVDLLVARAARTVVVSVEEIVVGRRRRRRAGADEALRFRGRPARRGPGGARAGRPAAALPRGRRVDRRAPRRSRRRPRSRPEPCMSDDRLVEPVWRWMRPSSPLLRDERVRETVAPLLGRLRLLPRQARGRRRRARRHPQRRRPRAAARAPRQGRRARTAGALTRGARAPLRRAPLRPDRRRRRRCLDLGHDRDADLLRVHRARRRDDGRALGPRVPLGRGAAAATASCTASG